MIFSGKGDDFFPAVLKLPNCRCYYFLLRVKYNIVEGVNNSGFSS